MSLSNNDEFYHKECDKVDANCINAYTDFHLDEDSPTGLCLETSWGGDCLDLTSIVKAAETVTTLALEPTDNPTCLVFHREDGQADCIHGDALSRIISMTKLKDVDQGKAPVNGDVYMYRDGKFYTFNLQQFVDDTNLQINNLNAAVTQLRNQLAQLRADHEALKADHEALKADHNALKNDYNTFKAQVQPMLNRWHLPVNVPDDAKILLGNINIYSDYNAAINSSGATTSLNKNHGVYGHDLNTDKNYDEIFG